MERNCMALFRRRWAKGRFLSVGLDSDMDIVSNIQLPWSSGQMAREAQFIFNRAIVDATHRWASAYKLNFWFYASEGEDGFYVLRKTIAYIHEQCPLVPAILDFKGGDIGNTSKKCAKMAFDLLQADAVTVHPYLGREGALEPFLERSDKGIFVLCRTSNFGAQEFQDFACDIVMGGDPAGMFDQRLYEWVASKVANEWNRFGNCGLVVGATYPEELKKIRRIASYLPILIPGVGAQGGELEAAVRAARDRNSRGFIINASRSVIFASSNEDFAERAADEARRLHRAIRKVLKGEREKDESPTR